MKTVRSVLQEAGLGHFKSTNVVLALMAASVSMGGLIYFVTGLLAFGIAAFIFGAIAFAEALLGMGKARAKLLLSALPELAEGIASAIASGQDIPEAISELSKHGPRSLRKSLSAFVEMDELGYPFEACLDWLRVELANVHADNIIELLKACGESGGHGLVESLMRTSANLRSDLIVHGELQAKQGWVAGTAKLAVFAPWLVAWMLSRRPEAFDFYNSALGNSILLGGLCFCVLAYILINRFGRQAQPRRVFPS